MSYSIIQPPFTLQFRDMSKPELKAYFEWFDQALPQRVQELETEVRQSSAHSGWQADFSVDSLTSLGNWFEGQVATRAKSHDELEGTRSKLAFPIEVSGEQLTNRTFSLAMDIGMYFTQVVLKNLQGTKLDQPLRNEKFADYGQPVIMGFGSVPLNPVRIVVMLAYGLARKKHNGSRLRQLYDTWAAKKSS